MLAAQYTANPDVITTLLKSGANPKEIDMYSKRVIDYAKENENLKNTDAYWELNDLSK